MMTMLLLAMQPLASSFKSLADTALSKVHVEYFRTAKCNAELHCCTIGNQTVELCSTLQMTFCI